MFSLRAFALLTALLSATASANHVIVYNKCSYDLNLRADRVSVGTQTTLAAGGTSEAFDYNSDALHVRVWTGDDINANLAFEILSSSTVAYDVVDDFGNSAVGHDFIVSSSSSDCPGIDGASADITPTDSNTGEYCTTQADFTWTLCG